MGNISPVINKDQENNFSLGAYAFFNAVSSPIIYKTVLWLEIFIFQPDILDDMRKFLPRHHKELMHSETDYRIIMKGNQGWCRLQPSTYGNGQFIQPDSKVSDKVIER